MALRRLTIYLLRDVADFDDAVDSQAARREAMAAAWQGIGQFYATATPPRTPTWVSFVAPTLASTPQTLRSSSSSGLLVIKGGTDFFALTFGYGRSFLDQSKIQRQFGLRVALNAIDPSQMRSLDTKTFEDMVVSRTTQTSRSTELPAFSVDISRDILRAVVGEPRDRTLAKRIAGADALVVNRELAVADLPAFCQRLRSLHQQNTYKADFAWVDQLALVEDANTVDQLNDQLVGQLCRSDSSNTHMAMPDTLEWEDVDSFRIGGTRKITYDDLDLDQYLNALPDVAATTLQKLQQRKVQVKFSRSDDYDHRWGLYQCLVSEQRIGNALYALIEGRWFAIAQSLADEVDDYVQGLQPSAVTFPSANPGETEAEYNERLATCQPALLNLDAKIKRPGGASTGIEFCDLLTTDREIIHVKRKSRSATLSHLFAQGRVSATTFLTDGTYRDGVRSSIVKKAGPAGSTWLATVPASDDDVVTRDYRVSYVIITDSKRGGIDWLPFFSKLNLMQTGRELTRMGFALTLTKVPIA